MAPGHYIQQQVDRAAYMPQEQAPVSAYMPQEHVPVAGYQQQVQGGMSAYPQDEVVTRVSAATSNGSTAEPSSWKEALYMVESAEGVWQVSFRYTVSSTPFVVIEQMDQVLLHLALQRGRYTVLMIH